MDVREKLRAELGNLVKAVIGTPVLEDGGKLNPAKLPGSGVRPKKKLKFESEDLESQDPARAVPESEVETVAVKMTVGIAKANNEQQIITGVVLEPETVDAQGDIYSSSVIEQTAYDFLAKYNKDTRLGLQHKSFKNPGSDSRFEIVESYIAPIEFALGSSTVKAGSWLMSVKVHDSKIWKSVKDGEITGFSIGGMSKTQKL